jgi:2-amino-4-hydroxy-6-hydroxymethyldihydropteridine diphosphokinase
LTRWLPAYVGLGSNLDDPRRQLDAALSAMRAADWVRALQVSRPYGSRPLGGREQPDYLNAVAAFLTRLEPEPLLERLRELELRQGRPAARERWASRRIDLDLLSLGDLQRRGDTLTLPHPGIVQRNFVLYPWAELAPDLWLPGLGRVRALAGALSQEGLWVAGEKL